MLRQENSYELQELKAQVKELSDEVMNLKMSMKTDIYKAFGDQALGRNIGKTMGNALFRNSGNSNYNKQLLGQFYNMFSNSLNVPNSFGNFDKN